jgi:outer membrane protein OmpA-like peptidoglycan-associated protein
MRNYLFILLLIVSHQGYTQTTCILKEDFSNNFRGWLEYTEGNYFIAVQQGTYVMNTPAGGWISHISPDIIETGDFTWKARFKQIDGEVNNGFGFVWGYGPDSKKLNNFVISSNGYGKVWSSDETRTDAREWKKIDAINPVGTYNHLKIVQQKGVLYFFVNDSEVFSMPSLPWFGKSIGFVTYTTMKVEIDDVDLVFETRINLAPEMRTGLQKENLGNMINTAYDEVTPVISADGKTLYFSREKSPQNIGGVADESDVWVSQLMSNNTWGRAVNLGPPVNSEKTNNIAALSQDNNLIILVSGKGFDVYQQTSSGWTYSGPIVIEHGNESSYFEATLSANGKAILFAAKNKQNYYYSESVDERDIFVSLKDNAGNWGAPVNLGNTINTRGGEDSPFLAADGKTLYFASDGHPGFGGKDIFVSKRLDDTWTRWSTPVNLGPEINSFRFDAYYTIPASGNYAYLCTNSDGFGQSDIVRINLTESAKPEPVVLLAGRVLNAKTKKPVAAAIVFENLKTAKEVGEAVANGKTGDYRVALPYGVNYGLHAKAKGYLSVNENLELENISTYTELKKDLYLVPVEVGEVIQLNNVFFEQGRAILKPESFAELDRLVQILKDNPTIEIELSGHTDNVGNPSGLIVLSQERVATVKKYLVSHGIVGNRIIGKGLGAAKPLVKNDSEENRKMNRRVEFKIIRK